MPPSTSSNGVRLHRCEAAPGFAGGGGGHSRKARTAFSHPAPTPSFRPEQRSFIALRSGEIRFSTHTPPKPISSYRHRTCSTASSTQPQKSLFQPQFTSPLTTHFSVSGKIQNSPISPTAQPHLDSGRPPRRHRSRHSLRLRTMEKPRQSRLFRPYLADRPAPRTDAQRHPRSPPATHPSASHSSSADTAKKIFPARLKTYHAH